MFNNFFTENSTVYDIHVMWKNILGPYKLQII